MSNRHSNFVFVAEAITKLKFDNEDDVIKLLGEKKKAGKKENIKIKQNKKKKEKSWFNNKKEKKKPSDKNFEEGSEEDSDGEDDNKRDSFKDLYLRAEEEILAKEFYKSKSIYREGSFSLKYSYNPFGEEDDDKKENNLSGKESELYSLEITDEEAGKVLVRVQYSSMLGSLTDVDYRDRERLSMWVKFNVALMKLYEGLFGITGDVNYDRIA